MQKYDPLKAMRLTYDTKTVGTAFGIPDEVQYTWRQDETGR